MAPNHEGNRDESGNALLRQFSALSSSTKVVTLTIGGNDLGFSDVLSKCLFARVATIRVYGKAGCSHDSALVATVASRLAALADSGAASTPSGVAIEPLRKLLRKAHALAPNAHVYVADYPELFGSFSGECGVGTVNAHNVPTLGDVTVAVKIKDIDAAWLDSIGQSLSRVIRKAANAAGATFVGVDGQFTGHRLCDAEATWIQPVAGDVDYTTKQLSLYSGSFHPDSDGQLAYSAAFKGAGVAGSKRASHRM